MAVFKTVRETEHSIDLRPQCWHCIPSSCECCGDLPPLNDTTGIALGGWLGGVFFDLSGA